MQASTPLAERLAQYIDNRKTSLLGIPSVIKIHPKDAKEALTWNMEFLADDGVIYPIEVIGGMNTVVSLTE